LELSGNSTENAKRFASGAANRKAGSCFALADRRIRQTNDGHFAFFASTSVDFDLDFKGIYSYDGGRINP
jgi:hypothetical protein